MLNIDVAKIKSSAEELKRTLNNYEESVMTLAKEMQDSELDWHDDNSAEFFSKIEVQKGELKEFLKCLTKVNTTYEQIVSKIRNVKSNINTLFVNEAYKKSISTSYSTAINNLNAIANRLAGLSTYFCTYYERSIINSEINRMRTTASNLENSKKEIEKLFSNFAIVENEIKAAMSRLEVNTIGIIDFAQYL